MFSTTWADTASAGSIRTWDGGGIGDSWLNPQNWDPDFVPVADDEVIVDFGTPDALSTAVEADDGGSITINGAGGSFGLLDIGPNSNGALDLNSGALVSSTFVTLGAANSGDGTATLSGASSWQMIQLLAGAEGTASLNISGGSVVDASTGIVLGSVSGSNAIVSVDGTGSELLTGLGTLTVGGSGIAQLDVTADAMVSVGDASIGESLGSSGTVTIDAATGFVNGSLTLGEAGSGAVAVSNGGALFSDSITVGDLGTATLDATLGAEVFTNSMTVASGGAITVTGSTLTSGDLDNQGTIDIAASSVSAGALTNTGTVHLASGSLSALSVNSTGTFDWTGGQLAVTGPGGLAVSDLGPLLALDAAKVLQVTGTTVVDSGTVLSLADGTLATGGLSIEPAGTFGWTTGTLQVTGGGGLDLNASGLLASNSTLGAGQALDVANATQIGPASSFSVDGGLFSTQSLAVDGAGSEVHLVGGTATISDTFLIENGGLLELGAVGPLSLANGPTIGIGTLQLNTGAQLATPDLDLAAGGQVFVNDGTLQVTGGINEIDGVIAVGGAAGVASFGELIVGQSGNGMLDAIGGATLSSTLTTVGGSSSSDGTLNLDASSSLNTNSVWVGDQGAGVLNVLGGAQLSSSNGIIGRQSLSDGHVTVDGTSSNWSMSGDLVVGVQGNGNLAISGGASVSNSIATVGGDLSSAGGDGVVTVEGAGSSWATSSVLGIGVRGTGRLDVLAGAQVNNTGSASGFGTVLGFFAGSDGIATVDGTNSLLSVAGDLDVGFDGTGRLDVFNAGAVDVGGSATIASSGKVNLAAGTLTASQLAINGGLLAGVGLVTGNVANSGVLEVGDPLGIMIIDGDYSQMLAGLLDVGISGVLAGTEYDVLEVAGAAFLEGDIAVSLVDPVDPIGNANPFDPQVGDVFDVLTALTIFDSGVDLLLPAFADLRTWQSEIVDLGSGSQALRLTVAAIPEPGTALLLATGLAGLAASARRRSLH